MGGIQRRDQPASELEKLLSSIMHGVSPILPQRAAEITWKSETLSATTPNIPFAKGFAPSTVAGAANEFRSFHDSG